MAALAFAVFEQWFRRPVEHTLPVGQLNAPALFQCADVASERQRRHAIESRPLSSGAIGFNCVRTFN